jgi:hypothetical protein
LAKVPPGNEWNWLKEPATFCDAYTLQVWAHLGVVRFSFGEYTDGDTQPFYRAGIVMPLSDAKALVRSLNRAIREAEEDQEKEAAAKIDKPAADKPATEKS